MDTEAPEAPDLEKVEDKVSPVTGELKDGDETNDTNPTFSGTGEPGEIINLYDVDEATGEKHLLGSTIVDKDGKWSVRPREALSDGKHTLRIAQADAAGNENEEDIDFHLVIDTVAPGSLYMDGITLTDSEGEIIKNGGDTYDAKMVFKGEVGGIEAAKIEIVGKNNVVIATVDVDQITGEWSWDVSSVVSRKGYYEFQFRAVDAAGNKGSLTNFYRFQYRVLEKPDDGKDKGEEETPPDNGGEKPGDGDGDKGKEEMPPVDDGEESGDGNDVLPDNSADNATAAGGDLLSISYGQEDDGMTGYAIGSMVYPAFVDPAATDFSAVFHALADGVAVVSGDMSDILAYGATVLNMETGFDGAPLRFADSNFAEDNFVESGEFTEVAVDLEGMPGDVVAESVNSVPVTQMHNDTDVLHIDDLLYHGGEQQAAVAVHMVETLLAGSLLPFPQHDIGDIETAIACQQVIV